MTVPSNMESHTRGKARKLLKQASDLLWNASIHLIKTAATRGHESRSIRDIRVALEGEDRKSGLIGILSEEQSEHHWSVATNLPDYALVLRSIKVVDLTCAADDLDAAYATLQAGILKT